jgi:hypothetical protein
MIAVLSTKHSGMYQVVCNDCLWNPGRTIPEDQAFRAADTHPASCPGKVPAHYTKSQIARARKLLSGDY